MERCALASVEEPDPELMSQVSMRLARLLASSGHKVTSVIRNPAQSSEIEELGATPAVLSLEDDAASDFTKLFVEKDADVVYFSAGAGGAGGEERTKKVDYEGALKTFDAIEGVKGHGGKANPRLILVSALDIRNPDKIPEHYVCFPPVLSQSFLTFNFLE
jgi:nucleoside-diphosphate-sugar epimerase